MREPIGHAEAFAWWRAALEHYPETVPAEPHCGYFKTRLAKGGVYVPARVRLVQEIDAAGELLDDVTLACEVNGTPADAEHWWPYLAGRPITYQEYRYLMARNSWAKNFAPDDYAARPHERIDPLRSRIVF